MLNIPNTSLESDDEVELTCQGYVGKTNSGDSKAQIDLQIKFSVGRFFFFLLSRFFSFSSAVFGENQRYWYSLDVVVVVLEL